MVRFTLTLSMVILLAGPGFSADVKMLVLDEALKITLEKNRDIQKAEEYKNKVKGRYVEERSAALPQLTATGIISRGWDAALAPLNRYDRLENRHVELSLLSAALHMGTGRRSNAGGKVRNCHGR